MDKRSSKYLAYFLGLYWLFWWCPVIVFSCNPNVSNGPPPQKAPIVRTTLGNVQGVVDYSRSRQPYYKYLGIPFAEPPVGPLRFEAPVPYKKPWGEAVRQADKFGSYCLQFDAMLTAEILGNEDCLFLNIFTPTTDATKKYPVLVWVHGSGFVSGGSAIYGPKYFMDAGDIVVVTMNYRLASLGFLNTGDHLVRGNMGLKDQHMAFQFVRDNIANFGGDPNQVTVFGQSAGAASVHYHVISPKSKGLFQRAIMQSGSVFCPWAYTRSPQKQALEFGRDVGCRTQNTSILVDCLKKMKGKDIVRHHVKLMSPVHTQNDFFAPSTEAVQGEDTLISDNPFMMLKRGDFNRIPVIFGMNSAEGAIKTARLEVYSNILNSLDSKWDEYVPKLLHYDPARKSVSSKIRRYYNPWRRPIPALPNFLLFPAEPPPPPPFLLSSTQWALQNVTQMISDGVWFHATKQAATHHTKFAPAYLNLFSYISDGFPYGYNILKSARIRGRSLVSADEHWRHVLHEALQTPPAENPKRFGACHGDDIFYYWNFDLMFDITQTPQDRTFTNQLIATWLDFVRGSPQLKFQNVAWDPVDNRTGKLRYLKLDNQGRMINQPFADRIAFIESLNIRDPLETHNW